MAKYVAANRRSQRMHAASPEPKPPTDPRRQAKVNHRSRPVNLARGGSPRDRFHLLNSAPPAEERDLRERKRRLEGDTSRQNGSFSDSAPDSNRSPAVPSQAAVPEGPPNNVRNRRKQRWPTYAARQRRLEMPPKQSRACLGNRSARLPDQSQQKPIRARATDRLRRIPEGKPFSITSCKLRYAAAMSQGCGYGPHVKPAATASCWILPESSQPVRRRSPLCPLRQKPCV